MSNLLQKASIVTTPTAYGVGVLNSIKPAQSFSEELIINGDFSNGGTNWNYALSVWSFSSGNADCNGTQSGLSYLNQSGAIVSGKVYKATYEVTSITAGEIRVFVGDVSGLARTTVGVYTEYITATSTNFWLRASSTFVGSIDNVSVKEVTDADFDFTRTSSATRVNPDYLIETSATNTPRLDYTNGTASILLEPQSTNLLPYSEDFSQYFTSSSPVVSGGFLAPDGTNNAYKITNNTSSSVFLSAVSNLNSTSTRTIYAKTVSGTGTASLMSYFGNTNNVFTLTDQWQRFEVNGTTTSTGESNFYAVDFRGAGTLNEVLIWGAQAENLSFATSYIPTSGSTVTRAAETLNNAGNSDLFNPNEGVLYIETAALANDGTTRQISLSDGSSSPNKVSILYLSTTNEIKAFIRGGGAVSMNLSFTLNNALEFNKIALKYKVDDFALWVNGTEVLTDNSGAIPTGLSDLSFDDADGTQPFYGKCKMVAVFKEALSDTELACLTSTNNREIFLNYYYRMQYVEANTEALSCAEQTFNI